MGACGRRDRRSAWAAAVAVVATIRPSLPSVSSDASKRQNWAPASLLPQPTPTYHLLLYSKARTGSRYPVLIRDGIGIVGPRCSHLSIVSFVAFAEPMAPLPGPDMMGQKA